MKTTKQQPQKLQQTETDSSKQSSMNTIVQAYKKTTQLQSANKEEFIQKKENNTGLPDNLKSSIENLSGYNMDDVKVHYNSSQPATLQAHAYAQGTDIHVAPGQEKHVPHEAWHVVQQKQGRVKPTKQLKGTTNINDDVGLEKEADVMGAKAIQMKNNLGNTPYTNSVKNNTVQRKQYSIKREINLDLATKDWEKSEDVFDKKTGDLKSGAQSAKVRAKGQLYKDLGEEFPDKSGDDYDQRKLEIDNHLSHFKDDAEIVTTYRAAIYKDAEAGKRRKKGQAEGINDISKSYHENEIIKADKLPDKTNFNKLTLDGPSKWIGAHLVKREWGGDDNMWNVVAWPQAAENEWAETFEKPIDQQGLRGINPGKISINVKKEDEAIDKKQVEKIIMTEFVTTNPTEEGAQRIFDSPTFMERIVGEISKTNRAIESIPLQATGTNLKGSITLTSDKTKYNEALSFAEFSFGKKVKEELLKTDERVDQSPKGTNPLPKNIDEAEAKESKKQLSERQTDWESEKKTYKITGNKSTDIFEATNNLFDEKVKK